MSWPKPRVTIPLRQDWTLTQSLTSTGTLSMTLILRFANGALRTQALMGRKQRTTECFTAVTFEGGSIAPQSLQLDGTDEMLWAANNVDSFMQYHGVNRGRFAVNWATAATVPTQSPPNAAPAPEGGTEPTSGSIATEPLLLVVGIAALSVLLM